MNMILTKSQIGLDGVPAAETVLSHVDGERGELIIAGEHVANLAGKSSFEGVTARLWNGATGKSLSEANVRASLGAARERAFARLPDLLPATRGMSIVDGFRAAIAGLCGENGLEHEATIVGAFPVIAGALVQHAKGHAPIAPDPNASHAADTLRMLRDGKTEPREVAALDAYLVTVCDHGLNASTFAARVVASTQAGLTSATLAGLGALKGPLHGGAPGPVIAMLDAIAASGDAAGWISKELAAGRRIMGFGHRIYRVRDPRADVLKSVVRRLGPDGEAGRRLAFAETVEQAALAALKRAKPDRVLQTNVEFYTALLLEAAGFPEEAFTCVFAAGRTAGWIAHAREQLATGRLMRPQSRYIGPVPDLVA